MKTIKLPNGRRLPAGAWLLFTGLLAWGAWLTARHWPSPALATVPSALRPNSGAHFKGTVHYDLLAKLLADDRDASADDWLTKLAGAGARCQVASQQHPLLNRPTVDFTLSNHRGEPWNLGARLADGPVVLVFYLGYDCTACVHDLFVLDADLARFRELGAEVVAISGDHAKLTQARFEEFGEFGFPVLSDPDHAVANRYGAVRRAANPRSANPQAANSRGTNTQAAEPLHATFVIARDSRVRWTYRGESPLANNEALLSEVARLENKLPGQTTP